MAYPLRSNIPKVNQSNFGPVNTGPGAGLMAQGLKEKGTLETQRMIQGLVEL